MPMNEAPTTRKDWADLFKTMVTVDLIIAAVLVVAQAVS